MANLPHCRDCETVSGLRKVQDYPWPEYTCGDCYEPPVSHPGGIRVDGPSFDDLEQQSGEREDG